MDKERLKRQLMSDEGYGKHGHGKKYKDTEGHWTVGYGHLVIAGEYHPPPPATEFKNATEKKNYFIDLLEKDIEIAIKDAKSLIGEQNENGEDYPPAVMEAFSNMAFQLGKPKLTKFKETIRLTKAGKYTEASEEMLRSIWNEQTPNRAHRASQLFKSAGSLSNNNVEVEDEMVSTNEQGDALDLYSGLKLAFAETAAEEVKPITKEQIETSSADASGKNILPDFGDAPEKKDFEYQGGASLTQRGDDDYTAEVDALLKFKPEDFEAGVQANVEFSTNVSDADNPNYQFHIRKGGLLINMGQRYGNDVLGFTAESKLGKHNITFGAEKEGDSSSQFFSGEAKYGDTSVLYGVDKQDDETKASIRVKGKF